MVSANNNLSEYDHSKAPGGKSIRIALVVSEWNQTITDNLYQGARKTLLDHNVLAENIVRFDVPGSFELIYAASRFQTQKFDAIIEESKSPNSLPNSSMKPLLNPIKLFNAINRKASVSKKSTTVYESTSTFQKQIFEPFFRLLDLFLVS